MVDQHWIAAALAYFHDVPMMVVSGVTMEGVILPHWRITAQSDL